MKMRFDEDLQPNIKDLLLCLSKSNQMVFSVIYSKKKLKFTEILTLTGLSDRSVRLAIKKLNNLNLIIKTPDLEDLRSHYVMLAPGIQNYNNQSKKAISIEQ